MYGYFTHGTDPPSRPCSSGLLSLPNRLRQLPSPAHFRRRSPGHAAFTALLVLCGHPTTGDASLPLSPWLIGSLVPTAGRERRQFSWSHIRVFRTMPPANTLVRWVDKNAFAPIVRARPCPTLGRPVHHGIAASITAWYFSASLSDPASRRTPCSPVALVGFGAGVGASPWPCPPFPASCPFRVLLARTTGRRGVTPPLDMTPPIRASEGLEPS